MHNWVLHKLKRLKGAHKIILASARQHWDRDDTELMLAGTKYQNADIFATALSGTLWPEALSTLGVHSG